MLRLTPPVDAFQQTLKSKGKGKNSHWVWKTQMWDQALVSGRICLTFYTLSVIALTTFDNYVVLLCFSSLWAGLPKAWRLSLLKHPSIKRLSQSLSQILETSTLASPSPSFAGSKTFSLLSLRWPLTSRKSRYILSLYYLIIFKTLLITVAVLLLEMGFTSSSEAWVEPSPRYRSWFWFDLNGLHSSASAVFTPISELCKSSKLFISGSLLNTCVPAPAIESYGLYFLPSLSSC